MKRHVLTAGFLAYAFDGRDFMLPALAMRSVGAGFCFNAGRGISAFAPFALGAIATRYSLGTSIGLFAFAFAELFTILLARSPVPQPDGRRSIVTG